MSTSPPRGATSLSRYGHLRRRTFQVLEKSTTGDRLSAVVDTFLIAVIMGNMAAVVLESFDDLYERYQPWFAGFEFASVVLFTVEFALRLWTSDHLHPSSSRFAAGVRYVLSPAGLVDLLAILPFYLPFLISVDLRWLRTLRVMRFLRVFKLSRYNRSIASIGYVMAQRRHELLVSVGLTLLLLIVASTAMYYLESAVQPEAFPNIVASMWWAVATLTTVGYGDVVPVTGMGRLLGGAIAILGIGLVALPTAIISSGFIEELTRGRDARRPVADAAEPEAAAPPDTTGQTCPCCGKPLDERPS